MTTHGWEWVPAQSGYWCPTCQDWADFCTNPHGAPAVPTLATEQVTYFVRYETPRDKYLDGRLVRYGTHVCTDTPEHAREAVERIFHNQIVAEVTVCNDIWACTHSYKLSS